MKKKSSFIHGDEFLGVYRQTENSIQEILKKKKSIKKIILENRWIRHKSLVFKLTCETLKYDKILTNVLEEVFPNFRDSGFLIKIGIYDLCIGEKSRNPNDLVILETQFQTTKNNILLMLLKHRQECVESIRRLVERMNVKSIEDLVPSDTSINLPKYIRVNRHKTKHVSEFVEALRKKYGDIFKKDEIMDFLLIFPSDYRTHSLSEIHNGSLIVQDKASCIPSFVLYRSIRKYLSSSEAFGKNDRIKVIDSCAAPGNKTSLTSEYFVNGKEKFVFAFEKNHERFGLLSRNLRKYGISNVLPFHQDFLSVDVNNPMFRDVRCAIVDPSCSGSGIVNRVNVNIPGQSSTAEYSPTRIRKLSNFQAMVLLHALKFPSIEIVVYSTCSIIEEENEGVVREVIRKRSDFCCVSVHKLLNLIPRNGNGDNDGDSREKVVFGSCGVGNDDVDVSRNVLRTIPELDRTNGFFVAVLVKSSLLTKAKGGKRKRVEIEDDEEEEQVEEEEEEEEEEEDGGKFSLNEPPMKKRKVD